MAVVQISRIQHRRGKEGETSVPKLATAELGWSIDKRRLYIGAGTLAEGAPIEENIEILTTYSDVLSLSKVYTFKGDVISGFVIQTGPDSNSPIKRTLQAKLDDIVSVRDFGAVGDGVTDDSDAIQRAISSPLGAAQFDPKTNTFKSSLHRAVYFPAGVYRVTKTILIPPYTRLYGENKLVSKIIGKFNAPIARIVDSYFQYGFDFGATNEFGVDPYVSEFHIDHLGFEQELVTPLAPTFEVNGCLTLSISYCNFKGPLVDDNLDGTSANNYYIDRATSHTYVPAALVLNDLSYHNSIQNVNIFYSDFMNHNYGIAIEDEVINCVIEGCYFDRSFHAIELDKWTQDVSYYHPNSVIIRNNHFRYATRESIYSGPTALNTVSSFNFFYSAGLGSRGIYGTGINGPSSDDAMSPAISFHSPYNYSIGDYFDRFGTDYSRYKNVETNGYTNYVINYGFGWENGKRVDRAGYQTTLANAASWSSAGIYPIAEPSSINTYYRASYHINSGYANDCYTNLKFIYRVEHNGYFRSGELDLINYDGDIQWEDNYRETGDVKVEFQPVIINAAAAFNIIPTTDPTGDGTLIQGTGYPGQGFDDPQYASATGGSGVGLTVGFFAWLGNVYNVWVVNGGTNYQIGDVVTIAAGNNDAQATITQVKQFDIQYTSEAVGPDAVLSYSYSLIDTNTSTTPMLKLSSPSGKAESRLSKNIRGADR